MIFFRDVTVGSPSNSHRQASKALLLECCTFLCNFCLQARGWYHASCLHGPAPTLTSKKRPDMLGPGPLGRQKQCVRLPVYPASSLERRPGRVRAVVAGWSGRRARMKSQPDRAHAVGVPGTAHSKSDPNNRAASCTPPGLDPSAAEPNHN